MLERSEKALRLLCIGLAGVLVLEAALKAFSRNPVSGLKIPALPTLSTEADSGPEGKGTNRSPGKVAAKASARAQTNSLAAAHTNAPGTNLLADTSATQEAHSAHHSVRHKSDTNSVAAVKAPAIETNTLAGLPPATNAPAESAAPASGSNTLAGADVGGISTNAAHAKSHGKGDNATGHGVEVAMNGPSPAARPGMGKRGPDLPLPIQARVDRVVDSELFGPVFHPMPAGLLGIAGNMAFLRGPNGQTGAVKEGDELGGLKLLRIGINRVLVEEDGQKKELMIFQGLGGQSLLPN